MRMKLCIEILISLIFLFNINVSAYNPINNSKSIDSSFTTQDSSIQKIWEIDNNSLSSTKILVSANWIYCTLDSGLVYCYDFAGNYKWTAEIMGMITRNSVLYKDLFLVSTFSGDLYSINSNNGEILQVVGIGEDITSDLSLIEITTGNTKNIGVILGTSEGNIFCYDAFTFELLWKNNITDSPIISKPLVEDDKIILLNSKSSLYCINSKSGSLIWKYEFSDKQNFEQKNYPLCDGKNVFSLSPEGKLFAIDLLLGKKTWSVNTKDLLNQFYIASDESKLLLLNSDGLMTIFSTKIGKELTKINFEKSSLSSFFITENQENTIVGFSDGSVSTFDDKFMIRQLIFPTEISISSISVINKDEFIIKDINGNIIYYKIN